MIKFELKSGKKVEFSLSSIDKGLNLFRAFAQELARNNIKLPTEEMSLLNLLEKNQGIILNLASSENILECIKECCDKVLYDGQRFSMDLFEDEAARQDFFRIITIVGVETIRPFFPSLETVYSLILSVVLKK